MGSQGASNAFTIDVTSRYWNYRQGFTNTQSASSEPGTLNGVVYAINQQTSTTGISAELINGIGSNPYRIVLTGETEKIIVFCHRYKCQ